MPAPGSRPTCPIAPRRGESNHELYRLVGSDDRKINNFKGLTETIEVEPQELDSLHPVFSESNPNVLLPVGEGGREADG